MRILSLRLIFLIAAPIPTLRVESAPRPTSCRARMPGQYPTRGDFRPRLCDEAKQAHATGRFFLCARCRAQVLICSCCDCGNIYCERGCAEEARRTKQRAAGRRYQLSFRGRRNHAARERAYRARQKKVTHQGIGEVDAAGSLGARADRTAAMVVLAVMRIRGNLNWPAVRPSASARAAWSPRLPWLGSSCPRC